LVVTIIDDFSSISIINPIYKLWFPDPKITHQESFDHGSRKIILKRTRRGGRPQLLWVNKS
jgi:hypothetical protein